MSAFDYTPCVVILRKEEKQRTTLQRIADIFDVLEKQQEEKELWMWNRGHTIHVLYVLYVFTNAMKYRSWLYHLGVIWLFDIHI